MAQAFYPTNDGHVGNIQKLSMPQLLELIQRQEKLLRKKSFLKTLADKGEKITQHLSVLKEELQCRKQTANGTSAKTNTKTQESTTKKLLQENDTEKVSKINSQKSTDEQESHVKDMITDSAADLLEKDFENLRVQDGGTDGSVKTKHQFEIAVERAEQNAKGAVKSYQRLNRAINITSVEELPADLRASKPSTSHQKKTTKSSLQAEESAAVPPKYKYDETKVITLDESLNLQLAQKQKQEELQVQLAAEKLAQRLNIKLETYNPEGTDMSYRERKPGSDRIDSDDDDNDEDCTGAGMADLITSDTED